MFLVVPRGEGNPGRYEVNTPSLQLSCSSFSRLINFLEHDASRISGFVQLRAKGLLVYDRHNVIYAYGPLENFIEVYERAISISQEEVRFPSASCPLLPRRIRSDAKRILNEEEWVISPLRASDENPE